ncbi:MAG TPA: TAXI family TRAP transporter solute-binding subunit [Stellaceae bacterium]
MAEPRISRAVRLQFQGDWGQANLHRICGWLSQEMLDRAGAGSHIGIWTGRGGYDAILAAGRGEVDVALATPTAFAPLAIEGKGIATGEAFADLCALGTMPQTDRLVLAIDGKFGIRSFEELRRKAPPLRIATSPNNGVNVIGYAAQRVMALAGMPRATIEAWGGRYIERERPDTCIALMRDGEADAVIHEAIMTPWWQELADSREVAFLPMEENVLAAMERDERWPRARLPENYLRGMAGPFPTLDFSDFLLIARHDLPDDVAHMIAWCLCEKRAVLERMYRHIPPERSPVTYPLEPKKIATTSIELHPGAERYYREAKLI